HDRNAVANRISELGRSRNKFLACRVVFERALRDRTDQNFQKLWINTAGGPVGGGHGGFLRFARIYRRISNRITAGWFEGGLCTPRQHEGSSGDSCLIRHLGSVGQPFFGPIASTGCTTVRRIQFMRSSPTLLMV